MTRWKSTNLVRYADDENGFTLIELLVVVVIIGILVAIAIPLYLNYRQSANDKATAADVRAIVHALEECNGENGTYPASISYNVNDGVCTGQRGNTSAGSSLTYTPAAAVAGVISSFVLKGSNANGSSALYCFNSSVGGSVRNVAPASTC